MRSDPVLLEPIDIKIWNRLNEVDELFRSDKRDRAKTSLLTVLEDVAASLNPVHSAILVRILRMAANGDADDQQLIITNVLEKCALSDTYPSLESADILISCGNLGDAKYILEKQTTVSDLAFLEYEWGRMNIAMGDLAAARERFLNSYSIDPFFIRNYDMLIESNGGSYEWHVRKNIALLMTNEPADNPAGAFASYGMDALYRIYWEWHKGDKNAAKNMLDVTVGSENPEFKLAAARIYGMTGDCDTSLELYRSAYSEMTGMRFVGTELAHALNVSGSYDEALRILGETERIDPLNRKVMECKMEALSGLGKKADLKEYAESFMDTEHADMDGHVFAAASLSKCGLTSEAARLIDILISNAPGDPSLFILRSSNELAAGRYMSALTSADESVRLSPKDPECRCQRARILFEMGRYKKALRDIDAALSAVRTYVPALMLLKDVHMIQKDHAAVLGVCDDILRIKPNDSDVMKDKAYALDNLGRKAESLSEYRNALRIRNDPVLFENILTLLVRAERYEEMYGLFKEFSQEYINNAMVWRLKGNAEYAVGKYQEAMESFAEATDLSPNEPILWHSRGMAAEMAKQLKKAEEAFDKALLLDLDDTSFWLSKAVIQEKRGNLKGAVLALNRVISESPESTFALARKARILVKLGRYDEALFFIDMALKINTKDVAIHGMKKEILKHSFGSEQVIKVSDDILLVDPGNKDALYDKSMAQLSLGQYRGSLLTSDHALGFYPDDTGFMNIRKNSLQGLNDHEGVADICFRMLTYDPNDRGLRMDLADALAESGKADEAVKIYDGLLAEDPMDMRVTVMKAKIRSSAGADSEAAELFQEVMEHGPDDADTLNMLADAMVQQGLDTEASRVLKIAMKTDPADVRSYISSAGILMRAGEYDKAQDVLRDALKHDQKDPMIWKAIGEAQEAKGDLRQSLLSYDSAMKLGMEGSEMYALRGRVQESLGMDEAAINSYSLAAIKDPRSAYPLVRVSVIQMKLGRMNAAEQNLDAALTIEPKDPNALYHRAKLYTDAGKPDEARRLYAIYKELGMDGDISRRFRELAGDKEDGGGGRMFRSDTEMHSHDVLEYCYNTGCAVRDDEAFAETNVPENMKQKVLAYIGGVELYGTIDTGSDETKRMETLSRNLILGERISSIDSEPLVNIASAYMASGAENIDEAKRLVAYIYKVMTDDIEQDVYPDDVVRIAEELSSSAGDVTTFGIMNDFDAGVLYARMSKMLSARMSDSISFHV